MRRRDSMGIGPLLEIPATAMHQLPQAAAAKGIRVKHLADSLPGEFQQEYLFSAQLGQICCRVRECKGVSLLWLTFPKSHAFNPLAWPFTFYLSHRLELTMKQLGARRIEWPL